MSMTDPNLTNGNGMRGTADRAKTKLSETFSDTTETAKRAFEQGRERLGEVLDGAGVNLERSKEYVTRQMHERPITSAATAIGIGVVIGLLLAGSRRN